MIGDDAAWRKYLEDSYASADPETRRTVVAARMKIGPEVLLSDFLCCDKFDIMDRVQNIKLPTLVLCGTEDIMTPVKYANYLANKITGSVMVVIEGGTHSVFREKPKEVNQAIEDFLARLK